MNGPPLEPLSVDRKTEQEGQSSRTERPPAPRLFAVCGTFLQADEPVWLHHSTLKSVGYRGHSYF